MKKINLILAITVLLTSMSCRKEYDSPPVQTLPVGNILTVTELKAVYDTAGTYSVCLITVAADGCMDTACQEIIVGEFVCDPMFTLINDRLMISLLDVSITSAPISNWIWTFGDGSVSTGNPSSSHQYDTLGVYEVCLTIQADSFRGCDEWHLRLFLSALAGLLESLPK